MRTYSPKAGDADRKWHVIDAQDVVLGRLATHAAVLLRGKHKATFATQVSLVVLHQLFTVSSLRSTQHALLKRRSRECFLRTV